MENFLNKQKFGQVLLKSGVITEEQLQKALQVQKSEKKKLGEELVKLNFCTEEQIASALSSQLGLKLVDLKVAPVEPMAVERVPERVARKHIAIPIVIENNSMCVAMADPLSMEAIKDIQFAAGITVRPCVATRGDIIWAIDHHYNLGASVDSLVEDLSYSNTIEVVQETIEHPKDLADLKKRSSAAPVIRIVNFLISEAVGRDASDIHVEPAKENLAVRIRVDGLLRKALELPKWVQGAVISRIKIMASMDIAEKRLPQDGRIGVRVGGRFLDLRVSTMPTKMGEKVVIRILDSARDLLSLEQLGMEPENLDRLVKLLEKPQGIILVTGPTGSGKTTTLYAALNQVRDVTKNIITIEEPIEYELEGINQVAVNDKIDLTFAKVLRSVLRQDPDVIMIGEMRDYDTAVIAMQAALTGHQVFSTLHTNDSVSTITRLRNLEIPPYLIASTVDGVVAQRLIRKICPYCKKEGRPDPKQLIRVGITDGKWDKKSVYHGAGCAKCEGTGYKGRTGLFEFLFFSRKIRDLVSGKASESNMREVALAEGMIPLAQAALSKVQEGITTLEEVIKVVQGVEEFGSLCPACGHAVSSDFVVCPRCGEKIIENCPQCQRPMQAGWRFCPYCRYDSSKNK